MLSITQHILSCMTIINNYNNSDVNIELYIPFTDNTQVKICMPLYLIVQKDFVNGSGKDEQVTDRVYSVPERKERSSLPPTELDSQLHLVECTHGLSCDAVQNVM